MLGLLLAAAVWVVITGVLARHELIAAQRDLSSLRRPAPASPPATVATAAQAPAADSPAQGTGVGDTARLTTTVQGAASHTTWARRYTSGPVWYLVARVPVLGEPFRSVHEAAWAADRLTTRVLPPLVQLATGLASEPGDRGKGPLDLTALQEAAPALDRAAQEAEEVRARVRQLPHSTWLPAADHANDQLTRRLDQIAPAIADAATAAHIAPTLLGGQETRRYLVIFQNSAEARGTGGLPGAFAVLAASQGRLSFEEFANDTTMADAHATVDLGDEYNAAHGHNEPTTTWVNANLSPHLPYAARIWSDAWRNHSGRSVDGVIVLDPSAMSGLLAASGPAHLDDGTVVSAGNVVDLTERTSYARFTQTDKRKAFFIDVARATAAQLLTAADDGTRLPALLKALHAELRDGRIAVWSADPTEQRRLEQRNFAGTLPDAPGPLAGLVINNAAGTKLDYYLDRKLEWIPGMCRQQGREVTATVTLTNRAPRSGLPAYVTQRVDEPPYHTHSGDNRLLVSYHASTSAALVGAELDGKTALLAPASERGRPVYTLDLELPAGTTRTLTLHLVEPVDTRPPAVLRQPLVRPLQTTVHPYPACGA